MAKLDRKLMKLFAETAASGDLNVFGSLKSSGTSVPSIDPDTIQASGWTQGWKGGLLANESPTFEDFNSVFYVMSYFIKYLDQQGVPAWLSTVNYYTGSIAANTTGDLYKSLVDNNLNNALTDLTKWKPYHIDTEVVSITPALTGYTITAADERQILLCNTTSNTLSIQLPNPATSPTFVFTLKDSTGKSAINNITILRHGTEKVEGVAASYVCEAAWGKWTFCTNGTDWFIC